MTDEVGSDIRIRLHIECANGLIARDLIQIIKAVDDALNKSEKLQMKELVDAFGTEVCRASHQTCREAQTQGICKKGRTLVFRSSDRGSIFLEGEIALVGMAVWILQNTLSETFKEVWRESDLHKKIRDFLRKDLLRKASSVQAIASKNLHGAFERDGTRVEVESKTTFLGQPENPREADVELQSDVNEANGRTSPNDK